jgi:prepilin-type processing-associated H-X9-DG protein
MKRHITRQVLIARLAAVALLTLCFPQAQARAQGIPVYIVVFPSVGLVPGENLRLTLFKPDGVPVGAQVRLHHAGGANVLFGDGSVRFLNAGISQTVIFKRSDIPLMGEAGTGRIQVCASLYIPAEPRETIGRLSVSMETVSISDGTSNTLLVTEVYTRAPNNAGGSDALTMDPGALTDIHMGIIPGQALLVTLANPPASESTPVPSRVKLFENNGMLIAQSPDLVIPPGESRSFKVDRHSLALPGEQGTGRLQVRAHLETTTDDPHSFTTDPGATGMLVASFEIIDNSTGKTEQMTGFSNTIIVGERPPSPCGGDSANDCIISGFGNDHFIGIVPGQRFIYTVFNPNQPESPREEGEPIGVQVKVYDRRGDVIAERPEIEIPPGQFRSIPFAYEELGIAGQPGTGRAQVRIKPIFSFSARRLARVPTAIEIVDSGTGRTTAVQNNLKQMALALHTAEPWF